MVQADRDTERKVISILKVLSQSSEPLGSTTIARELESHGIYLSDRTVRYHLKIMDERGFTRPLGRDGRSITHQGLEELKSALAPEQIGFVIERITCWHTGATLTPGRVPARSPSTPRSSRPTASARRWRP